MDIEGKFGSIEPGEYEESKRFIVCSKEVHGGDYEAAFLGWYLASEMRNCKILPTRSSQL
jgi:hypothetical protein